MSIKKAGSKISLPVAFSKSIRRRRHYYGKTLERTVINRKTKRAPPFVPLVKIVRPIG